MIEELYCFTSPNANIVAPSPITTPAASRPNRAIITTYWNSFILTGIESTIASRTLNNVNKIKIKPSNKTAVSANSNEYPICNTIVYAKKAFSPIPELLSNGSFAYIPIINVALQMIMLLL